MSEESLDMTKEFFDCECFSTDCVLTATVDPEDEYGNKLWFEMAVKRGSFFYRVKQAFKFVFSKNKPWAFHSIMIKESDLERLQDIVKKAMDTKPEV